MLFLTATPFQLGHAELRNVLTRFEAIAWSGSNAPHMVRGEFNKALDALHVRLNTMQVTTDRLEKCWKRLVPADLTDAIKEYGEGWWGTIAQGEDGERLEVGNERIRSVMLAFRDSLGAIQGAQECLRPWVLRNARSRFLPDPYQTVPRRVRLEGAAVLSTGKERETSVGGLRISPENALPFLLAARITTLPECPRVFGEGIASSYEALIGTRREELSESAQLGDANAASTARGLWYTERLTSQDESNSRLSHVAVATWRKGTYFLPLSANG